MKSNTQINVDLHTVPQSPVEHQFSFFDSLQSLDAVQFKKPIDEFYSSLPHYYVADTKAPIYAATGSEDPFLSMGLQAGELTIPDATYDVHNSYDGPYMYPNSEHHTGQYGLSTMPVVQQDCVVPSPSYHHDYGGYSSPQLYSTAQVLNVGSHSNTCYGLHIYHMDAGMSNNHIPLNYVMQTHQEPESLRSSNRYHPSIPDFQAFGRDSQYTPGFSPVNECQSTLAPQNTPRAFNSDFSISPSGLETSLPSWFAQQTIPISSSVDTLFPTASSDFVIPHYTQSDSPPSTSFIPNTSFAAPHDFTAPIREPSPALPHPLIVLLPPVPVSDAIAESNPQTHRKCNKVRSRRWLTKFFDKATGRCKLCGQGATLYRDDRALEHIASKHVLQIVKNKTDLKAITPGSLIKTKAQFAYARHRVQEIRCRLCPDETCLVMREDAVANHIKKKHKDLLGPIEEAERKRVKELMDGKGEFYNGHDKFLYNFFHVS